MIRRRKWMWCALLLFGAGLNGPDATAHRSSLSLDDLRFPEDALLSTVGPEMQVNGLNMFILHFQTRLEPSQLADFLTQHFRGELRRVTSVDWIVLSHRDGPKLLSIQINPAPMGGSRGMAAISDIYAALARGRADARSPLPLLADARVLQDISAHDLGVDSRTTLLASASALDDVLRFYRTELRRMGFEPVTRGSLSRIRNGGALLLGRGGEQVSVAVARDFGVTLVALVHVHP